MSGQIKIFELGGDDPSYILYYGNREPMVEHRLVWCTCDDKYDCDHVIAHDAHYYNEAPTIEWAKYIVRMQTTLERIVSLDHEGSEVAELMQTLASVTLGAAPVKVKPAGAPCGDPVCGGRCDDCVRLDMIGDAEQAEREEDE